MRGPKDTFVQLGPEAANVRLTSEAWAQHLLVSGVTGSGKTATAKVIAEALSAQGVATFAIDAKGDFAGISQLAASGERLWASPPVGLWDTTGQAGHRFSLRAPPRAAHAPFLGSLLQMRAKGVGRVEILYAPQLIARPAAYAALLYQLITQLAEIASASGQVCDGLRLLVIVEETHLLFRHLPADRVGKLGGALGRLIGGPVSVLFVAPQSSDIPDDVDAMIGARVQHALWALSSETMVRLRRDFDAPIGDADLRNAVRELGIGEALVVAPSAGVQTMRRVQVQRPDTRDGPLTPGERRSLVAAAPTGYAPRARRLRGVRP